MKATNAIDPHAVITISSQTIDGLLDLLWETPERNDADRSEGECLRVELLKEKYPELKNKMGSAQALWVKLEDQKRLFGKKRNESIETGQNMTAT